MEAGSRLTGWLVLSAKRRSSIKLTLSMLSGKIPAYFVENYSDNIERSYS